MPTDVIILPSAQKDLEQIRTYLDDYSLTAFDRLLTEIEQRLITLSQFPEIGRVVAAPKASLRMIKIKKYALFYRVEANSVSIVKIVDGRRNPATLWDQPA
jgi:toxin ParE1/3/4